MSDDLQTLCDTGRRAIRKGKFTDAIDLFRQAVELDPDDVDAHEGLATACYLGKEHDEAITHFNRITQLKPRDARAFINLGALYNLVERHKEAADSLRKGIQRNGKSPEAYYNLGIAQKNLTQNAMAISAYRECVRLKPEMAEAHVNLANLYFDQKNLRKAISHYEKALQAKPDFASAQRGLNHVRQQQVTDKENANPFGRLVDESKLEKKGAAAKAVRQLTEEQRFKDRQLLQLTAAESANLAQQLNEHLKDRVEPVLLAIGRVMAQDIDYQQAMHDLREQYQSAVGRATAVNEGLVAEFATLRDHEAQMAPD
jgi:tetratricopeptide (TPR) repeat protein